MKKLDYLFFCVYNIQDVFKMSLIEIGCEFMKKLFLCIAVLTVGLMLYVTKNKDETIIVYSSMEQFRGEELQRQLDERFPDSSIRVMYMPTAKAAAKIHMEGTSTDADMIVGLESSYMDNIKSSLADISGFSTLDFLDDLKPSAHDNRYVTWERQAGSFIINTKVLEKHNLPIPTSYEELLDPRYEGLIAMPDPKSSGTGYFFYKSLVNTMGDDEALAYIDQLENNIKQFSESGSGPVKLLIQGEIGIGLGLTFQAVNEINKGNQFQIVFPKEGSPYSLTGTALLKGRETDEEIKEIFTFIVNDFLVYDKEYFSPEQILNNQNNTIENYPQNIHYADMHGIEEIKEKERLLELWKY